MIDRHTLMKDMIKSECVGWFLETFAVFETRKGISGAEVFLRVGRKGADWINMALC